MNKYFALSMFIVIGILIAGSFFIFQNNNTKQPNNPPKLSNVPLNELANFNFPFFKRHKRIRSNPTPTPAPTPTPVPTPVPTPTPTPEPINQPTLWGAYMGWRVEDGTNFETKVGQPMRSRTVFVHWGNENAFPWDVANALKPTNKTLIIFWEAMDYNGPTVNQPKFSYDAIIRGDWDSYIKSFAAEAKKYGGPVILIPFEEMNGDWYPWSGTKNGNTPEKHKKAYQHVRNLFQDQPNVKFGWAVNQDSVPDSQANKIEAYYPGNEYVDYVGVNGFNFGNPWMTFDQVFGQALKTLQTYNKPIYIFSMASAAGPQKAAWITDAFTQIQRHPEINGWTWFNENKEQNWLIWSDDASLKAFQAGL